VFTIEILGFERDHAVVVDRVIGGSRDLEEAKKAKPAKAEKAKPAVKTSAKKANPPRRPQRRRRQRLPNATARKWPP
jgi:hypothetical protein